MELTHGELTPLFIRLSSFRAVALTDRAECTSFEHETMYSKLIDGLTTRINLIAAISEAGRRTDLDDWSRQQLVDRNIELIYGSPIVLGDDLIVDTETCEYKVNGGEWRNAVSSDCDGTSIDYPSTRPLDDEELGPLAELLKAIGEETDLEVSAEVICYEHDIASIVLGR